MIPDLIPIDRLDLKLITEPWPFALRERARIERHWSIVAQEKQHGVWNGEVLMASSPEVKDNCFTARFHQTDYASLIAWRDWGWPDRSVYNCFGCGLVIAEDGGLLYGRMSNGTFNAGRLYPPGGSLEPEDVLPDASVDLMSSLRRELQEETGLTAEDARAGECFVIFDGQRLCVAQALRFAMSGAELRQRARDHIASEREPELEDVVIIRSPTQIDASIPEYAQALARHFLNGAT